MSPSKVVEANNVCVSFRGHKALDNLTLFIEAGKFTGLIGPNGAGKTTFIRLLLGLTKPDSGEIKVFGHPPGEAHSLISYVPQTSVHNSAFPISAKDVVMMGRNSVIGIGRFPKKADHVAVADAMKRVRVTDLAEKRFGALSGGQRQKILIARALASKPRLLLLDEPTTGVDVVSQDSFYALLHSMIKELNMTIVLVSHDIGVITSHVDDLICINQKVFCHGQPADVLTDGVIGQAYGCEAEILMHGHSVPHRLVGHHDHSEERGNDA